MIVCIGEAVIDMVRGSSIGAGDVFLPVTGGCPYNTSIAISRLGAKAAFLGRISKNFFGEIQTKRLRDNGVIDSFVIRSEENPILAFIKIEEGKEPEYAFYEEGTVDKLLSEREIPAQLPGDVTCIMFGSISTVMEPIATTIENFIFREAKNGKVIAFDPNIRPFLIKDRNAYLRRFEKLASVSAIVKISLEDFEYIDPVNVQPEKALEKLIGMGTRLAIVTLGPNGAMAMMKREDGSEMRVSVPGVPVPKLADTVGAGDTFHGAFLSWLEMRGKMSPNIASFLSEEDLRDALSFSCKAAAFVCGKHGAEPPVLREIE